MLLPANGIWNVTVMNTPDDEGVTYSFETHAEAKSCYDWAMTTAPYFCRIWK